MVSRALTADNCRESLGSLVLIFNEGRQCGEHFAIFSCLLLRFNFPIYILSFIYGSRSQCLAGITGSRFFHSYHFWFPREWFNPQTCGKCITSVRLQVFQGRILRHHKDETALVLKHFHVTVFFENITATKDSASGFVRIEQTYRGTIYVRF